MPKVLYILFSSIIYAKSFISYFFFTKLYVDGRLYIPKKEVESHNLRKELILRIKGYINGEILKKLFSIVSFAHNGYLEGKNKFVIRISSSEILQKINLFKNVFKYYPKRRKKFLQRFLNTGTCRYILGEFNTSNPIKSKLRAWGWLESEKLTKNDLKVRTMLLELKNELNQ